jgi:hypothetical protein
MVRVRPVLQAGQAYLSRRARVPPVRSFDRLKPIWPMKSEIILYARVSTRRQGKSGLGLSAQRKAVQVFADAEALAITSRWKPARARADFNEAWGNITETIP